MHIGGLIKRLDMFNIYHSCGPVDKQGLTGPQLDVLNAVYEMSQNGCAPSQRMLERRMYLSNPTVTGILNRLEAKGLIERTRDRQDARIKRVCLTQAGTLIRMRVNDGMEERERRLTEPLTDEEREQLEALLLKMVDHLEQKGEENRNEETESEL